MWTASLVTIRCEPVETFRLPSCVVLMVWANYFSWSTTFQSYWSRSSVTGWVYWVALYEWEHIHQLTLSCHTSQGSCTAHLTSAFHFITARQGSCCPLALWLFGWHLFEHSTRGSICTYPHSTSLTLSLLSLAFISHTLYDYTLSLIDHSFIWFVVDDL